jgi:hypothetical protein
MAEKIPAQNLSPEEFKHLAEDLAKDLADLRLGDDFLRVSEVEDKAILEKIKQGRHT